MALPVLLAGAGIAVAAAYFINDEVSSSQKEAIEAGKKEVAKRVKEEIELVLKEELGKYETAIMWQFYVAIACFLSFCIFWLIFDPLTWLIALIVSFASMYLLGEVVVLILYKDIVKRFRKSFWKNWNKDKLRLAREPIDSAAHKALMDTIYHGIKNGYLRGRIRAEVDRRLKDLNIAHTLAYNIFGDSRNTITDRIYRGALNAIDYESIIEQIKKIIGRIILVALTYSAIAFLLRVGIIELSGLGWMKWILLPVFFGINFWWHKRKLLSLRKEK